MTIREVVERRASVDPGTASGGDGYDVPVWGSRATWQITLRWFVPPAILAGVLIGRAIGLRVPVVPLVLTAGFIQTYNLVFWLLLAARRHAPAAGGSHSAWPAVAQIALDYAAMFLLVHYSGAASSPLLFFFLFHVIFAAILLEARVAWCFAIAAVIGVTALAVAEHAGVLPAHPLTARGAGGGVDAALTVFGFGVAALVTAGMTATIATRLRRENARAVSAQAAVAEARAQLMLQVAHNLRSPLTASMSVLDLLLGGYVGGVSEAQASYLERLRTRLAALSDMIGELLTLARSRDAAAGGPLRAVDLGALAEDVVATYAEQATSRAITLDVDAEAGLPAIEADADALRRVLENLIGNAVKYTRDGGHVAVEVTRATAARLRLVVRDDGIGIPAAEQAALFSQFFRASNARALRVDGTGLGLAIVRQTVERHGGTVSLESTENVGTTVTVELPAPADARTPRAHTAPSAP